MKKCSKCKQQKQEKEFYKNRSYNDKLTTQCKICIKQANKERYKLNPDVAEAAKTRSKTAYKLNPDKIKARSKIWNENNFERRKIMCLKNQHNISIEEYHNLLKLQNNTCAICGKSEHQRRAGKLKSLAVDHDHLSNTIRGLLCSDCNIGLGHLKDDPEIILKAYEYIMQFNNRKGE